MKKIITIAVIFALLALIVLRLVSNKEKIEATKKQMSEYFLKAMHANNCVSVIATCDEMVVGIGSFVLREQPANFKNLTGRWAYIMNMYTTPAFRRKGICKNILDLLIDEAKQLDITAFELHATKEGEQVYKQNGFQIHNEPTYRKFITI